MWYAVYQTATGALVSLGTVIADPLPSGLSAVAVGTDKPLGQWNSATLVFDAPVVTRTPIAPLDFMRRFTMSEEAAIRTLARTDAMAEVFLSRLAAAQIVHLDNQETIDGVNYCISAGTITAARGSVILNG
jgi:hypothetical protein